MGTEPLGDANAPERDERAYLIVTRNTDIPSSLPDENLIELGDTTCDARSRGGTDIDIMAALMTSYSYEDSRAIYAGATTFLCPDSI
ncbi:DUF732 domain-containing protein [Streptomyces phaeochromogenes]